jgi:hypothetical protein
MHAQLLLDRLISSHIIWLGCAATGMRHWFHQLALHTVPMQIYLHKPQTGVTHPEFTGCRLFRVIWNACECPKDCA